MPLRSFSLGASYPCTAGGPPSTRPCGPNAPQPASAQISHPGTLLPHGFFVAPRAAAVPADCSCANSASARLERRSSTASLRSLPPPSLQHRPVSSLSISRPPVRPSVLPRRDLPV